MKDRIERLKKVAADMKPGFVETVLSASENDGETFTIAAGRYDQIFKAHQMKHKIRGAGDVVHAAVKPFVQIFDRVAGTHLESCMDCAERRIDMNPKPGCKSCD